MLGRGRHHPRNTTCQQSCSRRNTEANTRVALTSESPRRGVPGIELVAEPDREPDELMRMRRPSLSNLGGGPVSLDHPRCMAVGRRGCDWWPEVTEGSLFTYSVWTLLACALTMAAAASGSCKQGNLVSQESLQVCEGEVCREGWHSRQLRGCSGRRAPGTTGDFPSQA